MNYKHWNYLRNATLVLCFSGVVAILFGRWLAVLQASSGQAFPSAYLYIGLFTAILISIGSLRGRTPKWAAYSLLGLVMVGQILFGHVLGYAIYVILPLFVMLFFASYRFLLYSSSLDFKHDLSWAVLFLIFTSLAGSRWNVSLDLGGLVLFFAFSLILITLFHGKSLENAGYKLDYGRMGRTAGLFGLCACLLAFLIGGILSPQVLSWGLSVLKMVYNFAVDIFLFVIIRPLAWLMSPIFNWVEQLEVEWEWESPQMEEFLIEDGPEQLQSVAESSGSTTLLWYLGILILGIIIFRIIFRIMRAILQYRSAEQTLETSDERESLLSRQVVWAALKQGIRSLAKPFAGRKIFQWATDDNPISQVRMLYIRFVWQRRKQYPYDKATTPHEYEQQFAVDTNVNHDSIRILTQLYEEARYGERVKRASVLEAKEALKRTTKR